MANYRHCLKAALMCFALFIPSSLTAQNLTPSEQAAASERGATDEEQAVRKEECALDPTVDAKAGHVSISETYSGPVVFLPPVRMLQVLYLGYEGPESDTHRIGRWPDLPNGGLAGFDVCGSIKITELRAAKTENDVISRLGLRLRQNVDLEYDYPNAYPQIQRYGQVLTTHMHRYLAIKANDTAKLEKWLQSNHHNISNLAHSLPIITIEQTVYVAID